MFFRKRKAAFAAAALGMLGALMGTGAGPGAAAAAPPVLTWGLPGGTPVNTGDLTATYAPVRDTTIGSLPLVSVN